MDKPDDLIASIREEDRLLQERLSRCPEKSRDQRGSGGSLSFKETLGHLAFWDNFAVRFFTQKLDVDAESPAPPINFEERSRRELERIRALPFAEVFRLYREATRNLIQFLRNRWVELSSKERRDFQVPLKHRRHHRILLERALGSSLEAEPPRQREGRA